jgi:hypothetical protein
MGEACNTNGRDENWIQELRKSEGNRSFGRPTHTWEIILNWTIRKCLVEMWVCIQPTENKDQ